MRQTNDLHTTGHKSNDTKRRKSSHAIAHNTACPVAEEETLRLNKAIAESGFCSRRKADDYIFQGAVYVNGAQCIDPSQRVTARDTIAINGTALERAACKKIYLLLNKPIHTVSTAYDPEGRPTVLDCLPKKYQQIRLYPVGRLDYFSEGLLLLTNDGKLTNALLHPRYHLPKTYLVTVRGFVSPEALKTMQNGMVLSDGQKLLPVKVQAKALGQSTTLLSMVLRQGINRQIRRMCEDLSLTILRLIRIAEGPLHLGDLASGTVRELTAYEIKALKDACHNACHTRFKKKDASS